MTLNDKNDLHYVCSLMEFLSRKLRLQHHIIAEAVSPEIFAAWMRDAAVNHCLSFEEVADSVIPQLHLTTGDYDVSADCRYKVPSVEDIGWLYQRLILAVQKTADVYTAFRKVFTSFIPDKVSHFNSAFYYASPDYIRACYEAGKVLD